MSVQEEVKAGVPPPPECIKAKVGYIVKLF